MSLRSKFAQKKIPLKSCCFALAVNNDPDFFYNGACVTIASLQRTNPSIPIVVLYSSLEEEQLACLKSCEVIKVNGDIFNTDHRADIPNSAFFRFYISEIPYDKIIYVDCDIVVLDTLNELFERSGRLMAKGRILPLEIDFENPTKLVLEKRIKEGFLLLNSGFLVLEKKYWANNILIKECISLAKEFGWSFFKNPDQGMLNVIAYEHGGFINLSKKYNFTTWPDMESRNIKLRKNERGLFAPFIHGKFVKVVHYTGPLKPWLLKEKNVDEAYLQQHCYKCYNQFLEENNE